MISQGEDIEYRLTLLPMTDTDILLPILDNDTIERNDIYKARVQFVRRKGKKLRPHFSKFLLIELRWLARTDVSRCVA